MSPAPAAHPARMVLTDRAGGVSAAPWDSRNLGRHVGDDPAAVHRNRERTAAELGVDPAEILWLDQVHSTRVITQTGPPPATPPRADAAVTAEAGTVLAVMVADCVPVLLADETAGVIGAAHAGRAGAAGGIVPAAVAAMTRLGARPERIRALLGPAAGGASYEVPEDMAAGVERALPGSRCRTAAGTPGLDLRAGLERQLGGLGVREIVVDPRDTIADPAFFSHRREGRTGRQAGLIWMPRPGAGRRSR